MEVLGKWTHMFLTEILNWRLSPQDKLQQNILKTISNYEGFIWVIAESDSMTTTVIKN